MDGLVDNIELLLSAVVRQAAEDYREALVKQHRAYESGRERDMKSADIEVEGLETFFTGGGCDVFTKLDGAALMERLKQQVKSYNYDLKKLKKDLRLSQGGAP